MFYFTKMQVNVNSILEIPESADIREWIFLQKKPNDHQPSKKPLEILSKS